MFLNLKINEVIVRLLHISAALALLLLSSSLSQSCKEQVPDKKAIPDVGVFNQLSPAKDEREVSINPSFSWEPSAGAVSFTLIISKKNDFSSVVVEEKLLTSTSRVLTITLENGTLYYWKVIAKNEAGESPALNSGLSFRTKAVAPSPSPSVSKYYVSPDGEDNPDKGSFTNPFKTISYGASRVPAGEGDTLYIKAGSYQETEPIKLGIGINLIGSGALNTIISSSGVTLPPGINSSAPKFKLWYDGSLIQLISPHRTVFRNNSSAVIAPSNGNQTIARFTIDGKNKSLKAGVWIENRNNVTLHHVTLKDLSQRGAVFAPGDKDFYVYPQFYMTGITIHDCKFINSGKDLTDETLGNLCIAQLDGANIYNIDIQDNQGYGIKFIYDGYFKNINIHDCTISVNEYDAKWGEDIAIELWNLGPGNRISNIICNTWLSLVNHEEMFGHPTGTENAKVYGIRMIDKDGVSDKEAVEIGAPGIEIYNSYFQNKGFGMAVWDMGRENITIRNNVFYNSTPKNNWASGAAVYIDNSRTWEFRNINIFNNVFDTHTVAVKIKGDLISSVQIKNNAFLNAVTSELEAVGNNISFSNNLKFKNGSTTWTITGATTQSDNVISEPNFNNTGNRWDLFYKPISASSFVVDKGTNVGLVFRGVAPDIGAFEF